MVSIEGGGSLFTLFSVPKSMLHIHAWLNSVSSTSYHTVELTQQEFSTSSFLCSTLVDCPEGLA